MTHGTLVLQAPSECIPDQPALIARLSDLGFVGAGYGETPGVYLAGPRFLQLITFLGCSPHLQLEPPADGSEDFCHIRLRGPFRTARLLSAGNTRPPRCPGCGKGLTNWRQLESLWAKGGSGSEIGCAACGRSANPAELDWRRKAGFGTLFY